jgi:hypothetical protein
MEFSQFHFGTNICLFSDAYFIQQRSSKELVIFFTAFDDYITYSCTESMGENIIDQTPAKES